MGAARCKPPGDLNISEGVVPEAQGLPIGHDGGIVLTRTDRENYQPNADMV